MHRSHAAQLTSRRLVSLALIQLFLATVPADAHSSQTMLAPDLKVLMSKETDPKRFGPAKWLDEGRSYTVVEDSSDIANAQDIVRYDSARGVRNVLIPARMLTPPVSSKPLSIDDYEWSKDGRRVLIYTAAKKVWREKTRGDYWLLDVRTGGLRRLGGNAAPESLMFASFSPDGDQIAYLRRDLGADIMATNLYAEDAASGRITPLTQDASVRGSDGRGRTIINGSADWVNEEEFGLRQAYAWAPDGKTIAYWQFDATLVRDFLLLNNTDALYPREIRIPYPKAGTTNATVRVGVIDVRGGNTRWLELPGEPASRYVPRIYWAPNSAVLVIPWLDRPQQHLRLLAFDQRSGTSRQIYEETSDTWIELRGDDAHWLDSDRLLWLSERDGWCHAWAIPLDGRAPTLLTPGAYDVIDVVGLSNDRKQLFLIASPGDAKRRFLYTNSLTASGALHRLTPAEASGTHSYDLAPNGRFAFHTSSDVSTPPMTELVSVPDHRTLRRLINNDALAAKLAPLSALPMDFVKVPLDHELTLDAWILRPPRFDPRRKYPVLVFVYGEPARQTVLDRWESQHKSMLFHRWVANRGYVVLSTDNRGTPAAKGRDWRRAIYGSVGVLASKEQAGALRALARVYPWIDLDRVAVWGWSGGGSMTLNLMFRHPDLYKVGIAVASVPDQRYYDTIYQERYMGSPQDNPDGYRAGSPIFHAEGLKGDLLIIHGTGDDNVHVQGTELLVNRLVELGKPFDELLYPNRSHSIDEGEGTRPHLYAMIARYLENHQPVTRP